MQLDVIGLGVTSKLELAEATQQALAKAKWIVGSERQLALLEQQLTEQQQTLLLPKLTELKDWLSQRFTEAEHNLVILASGDPLHYGIGAWLLRNFAEQNIVIHPALSSIQIACQRLGLAQEQLQVISLHGRPLGSLRRKLKKQSRLLVLTDQHSQPQALAKECIEAGFPQSSISICSALGYPEEQISRYQADELAVLDVQVNPLHISVIELKGEGQYWPEFPGIEDSFFITDAGTGKGQITKREVRLNILSLLAPRAGDQIWDLGAGCGSVSVELVYWQPKAQVQAVESHPERISCLNANREKFGLEQNLFIHPARAQDTLQQLAVPNKIFIGGSAGQLQQILEQAWPLLAVEGLLVVSAVTEQSKQQLLNFVEQQTNIKDFKAVQIAISHGEDLAGQLLYRPKLPVTLFSFKKAKELSHV